MARALVRTIGRETDWLAYSGDVSNIPDSDLDVNSGFHRRVGDSMEIQAAVELKSGFSFDDNVGPTLPNSKSVDLSKLPSGFTSGKDRVAVGSWAIEDLSASTVYSGTVLVGASTGTILLGLNDGTDNFVDFNNNDPITFADGDTISWQFTVPISGWGTN